MPAEPSADEASLRTELGRQPNKSLLRFLTCGSVDDGKSTLIGRLLYDTKLIFEDQLAALERDSHRYGTTGDDIDFALLIDGLEAEREQGITIDVAYRYFATAARKFIVADTPGHEQYTRNMATGASTADVAVLLVDARKGVLTQTRRHSFIASLLGIRHVVLAINKIDLMDYSRSRFDEIVEDFNAIGAEMRFESVVPIPMSARHGDNVTARSTHMPWYDGPTLLEHLERIDVEEDLAAAPFRLPVQYVNRPNLDFRGFAGAVAAGTVKTGDTVAVALSGKTSRVKAIFTPQGEATEAEAGEAVTLQLEDEIDVSRGSMLVAPQTRPHVADQFAAEMIWFDDHHLLPGRSYILRTETQQVNATVTDLKFKTNVDTMAHEAAKALEINEIGTCTLSTQTEIAFDSYGFNRSTGSFVLIDRMTNATAGAGLFRYPLRRSANVRWQALEMDRAARAEIKHQKPGVIWLTGLSGSGKSTIANLLDKQLYAQGHHTYVLDGDNVRHGLNRDLGFTEADRVENIRRVAEVAALMADAGLLVIVSFISPFEAERRMARERLPAGDFVEVFVDAPIEECVRRDPKGLYARAQRGEIANFTGIDSPYEAPENAEIHLQTKGTSPEASVEFLIQWLRDNRFM
ncbi:sulfate adenylyltransferase subunit CysN [Pararhizobium mangrovi]|uniref:Multifunctional fusion protein n=1 Tax=Pararhizobium mangrovi TaxID=2590452 RepID=A0A506U6N7_9HYPH|nr:sulfate adenylyltransferase subunit CysN [Pararhizobium mangrovi]TPW27567.1 sulfate adenylyltransferase subunit CysN [Pararhizobium mangrovi]